MLLEDGVGHIVNEKESYNNEHITSILNSDLELQNQQDVVQDDVEDQIEEDFVSDTEFEDTIRDFSVEEFPQQRTYLNGNGSVVTATWICLFLALFQYSHGITDSALEIIINFLHSLFQVLARKFDAIDIIAAAIPSSLYLFHRRLSGVSESSCTFIKYAVCIKCFSLYDLDDCYEIIEVMCIDFT